MTEYKAKKTELSKESCRRATPSATHPMDDIVYEVRFKTDDGKITRPIKCKIKNLCRCTKNTEPYFDTNTEQWKCLQCKLPQHY